MGRKKLVEIYNTHCAQLLPKKLVHIFDHKMDVFDTFPATNLIVSYYNCQLFFDQKLLLYDLASAYFDVIIMQVCYVQTCQEEPAWVFVVYNPLSKENHKRDTCSLRTISASLQKKYPSISIDAKLCVNCRK